MLKSKLICLGLAILVIIGIFPEKVCGEAEAANVTWVETTYDCQRRVNILTANNTYFGYIKQGSNCWTAHRIDKGTLIGTIYMSVSASRTATQTPNSYYAGTYYGATWGNSYDIYITMQPRSSFSVKPYIGSNYSMTDAKVWKAGTYKTVYPASEDLVNWCYTSNSTSKGFLCNWSPKDETNITGSDDWDISFGFSLKNKSFDIDLGKKITISDDYVDGYDDTSPDAGRYRVRYDYKKYNAIGYCTSGRKKRIFETTTVHDSVYWRNKSKTFEGYVYAKATFTVCDSRSWPEELVTASSTLTSIKMVIK